MFPLLPYGAPHSQDVNRNQIFGPCPPTKQFDQPKWPGPNKHAGLVKSPSKAINTKQRKKLGDADENDEAHLKTMARQNKMRELI